MISWKNWMALGLCWSALIFECRAQALLNSEGDRPPPGFGVVDQGGFFNRNASALKRIAGQIRRLEQEHGYMIYLVIEPVLIASTASERAAELREAWVPEGNGLVVVFESDSRDLGIGRDLAGRPIEPGTGARIPSHETAALLDQAMAATDANLVPDLYLEALIGNLTTGFDAYFKRRAAPPPAERTLKITLLVVGTLALLGLGAIGVGGLVRHSSMVAVRSFRFPPVDRPERLGAPCGGDVTARRFAPPGPRI